MARVARTVVTPVRKRPQNQTHPGRRPRTRGTVTLADTPDAAVPGRYGLWFDDDTGYASSAGSSRRPTASVTRTLLDEVGSATCSPPGGRGSAASTTSSPEELGLAVRERR